MSSTSPAYIAGSSGSFSWAGALRQAESLPLDFPDNGTSDGGDAKLARVRATPRSQQSRWKHWPRSAASAARHIRRDAAMASFACVALNFACNNVVLWLLDNMSTQAVTSQLFLAKHRSTKRNARRKTADNRGCQRSLPCWGDLALGPTIQAPATQCIFAAARPAEVKQKMTCATMPGRTKEEEMAFAYNE